MRILLLNPPAANGVLVVREGRCMQRAGAWTAVWAPVTLATTAALLLAEGHEVLLRDCIVEGLDSEDVRALVRAYRPQLVVLNTGTPSIDSDLRLADEIKASGVGATTLALG
ncbi:MAG: hypothetical protein ABIK62_07870, partial [candidate division WOR-3 bacterium]